MIQPEAHYTKLAGTSPIYTVGRLREIIKDIPDNTTIALSLEPLRQKDKDYGDLEALFLPRAHKLLHVGKGALKNGKPYIILASGEEISDKIFTAGSMMIADDTVTSN